jgi:ligand-binding SRPBCC domain-containing protein
VATIRIETKISAARDVVFDLSRDIDFHQRSLSETGESAVAGRTSGLIGLGESVTWRAKQLGLWWSMTSRITEFERPARFVDEQVRGPFTSFRHEHLFELDDGGTLMVDNWHHVAPLGPLGRLADELFLERLMRNLLLRRNAALTREAEAAQRPSSGAAA